MRKDSVVDVFSYEIGFVVTQRQSFPQWFSLVVRNGTYLQSKVTWKSFLAIGPWRYPSCVKALSSTLRLAEIIAEFTLPFLTWCYFFWHDVIFLTWCCFFDLISVNPLFVQDGVKKITTSVCFCTVLYKTTQTFDIVLKKIHRPNVNRFDGDIFLVRFDY